MGCLFNENPFKRVVGLTGSLLGPAIMSNRSPYDMGDPLAMNEIDVVIHCATTHGSRAMNQSTLMPVVQGLAHRRETIGGTR